MLDLYYPAYVNYDARKIQGFDSYELKEREATHEQMRFMISRIVDTVSVELTQSKYASLAAFVRRSQNWETPTISITTDALFRLEAAIQSTECPGHKACHFLLYLFVVAYHEIGHLLGRYVRTQAAPSLPISLYSLYCRYTEPSLKAHPSTPVPPVILGRLPMMAKAGRLSRRKPLAAFLSFLTV